MSTAKQDHRLSVEVWDWDRTTRNDFIGSMSFPLREFLAGASMSGWYKLLEESKGAHYYEPCAEDEKEDEEGAQGLEV